MAETEKKEEEKPAAPVFGAGAVFGAAAPPAFGSGAFGAGGFGSASAFGAATFGAPTGFVAFGAKKDDDDAEGEGESADPEAECTATFKPLVQLEEVVSSTGEEDEDISFEAKAKAYRFSDDSNEWKEKGVGPLKLLQHKETKKIRLLMRRDKTLKICANFLILPGVKVSEHAGSDKSAVFTCQDFSDESTGKQEKFCVRFGTIEKMEAFRKAFGEAQKNNAGLGVGAAEGTTAGAEDEPPAKPKARVEVEDGEEVTSKAADELAGALGKVAV